jgi:hypothetical protein
VTVGPGWDHIFSAVFQGIVDDDSSTGSVATRRGPCSLIGHREEGLVARHPLGRELEIRSHREILYRLRDEDFARPQRRRPTVGSVSEGSPLLPMTH